MFSSGAGKDPARFFRAYGLSNGVPFASKSLLIASGYGAQFKRWFKIPPTSMAEAEGFLLLKSAQAERDFLAKFLGRMEAAYSQALGITDDAGMKFSGSGNAKQFDCVDEAWNATAVLLWLAERQLLRFHTVREPLAKWSFFRWNHYSAILVDAAGIQWSIDGGTASGGSPPLIIESKRWYE